MDHKLAISILSKKMGVLLKVARLQRGESKKTCGEIIGVSSRTITKYESGEKSPSLPELEVLGYYLDLPLENFWGDTASDPQDRMEVLTNLANRLELRNLKIGASLRKYRLEADMNMKDVADKLGITTYRLKSYEQGSFPVPAAELNALARLYDHQLRDLVVDTGPIADWVHEKLVADSFVDLPKDLQDFVIKPVNRPYLELAVKLSQMDVDQMRDVAERLLDITL